MSCSFDKDIIQKYADNTIDPLELIVLREHIAVCGDCKFELELQNKIDSSMYEYFDSLQSLDNLDELSMNTLNECYTKSFGFKDGIAKAWEINKMLITNTASYTAYLPGSKLAANTAKKASAGMSKAVKGYIKNSFVRLLAGAAK